MNTGFPPSLRGALAAGLLLAAISCATSPDAAAPTAESEYQALLERHRAKPAREVDEDLIDDLEDYLDDYEVSPYRDEVQRILEERRPWAVCDEIREEFDTEPTLGIFDTTNYQQIINLVQQVEDRHPYHPCVREARLMMADAFYKREDYVSAEARYREYETLYPRDEQLPYVLKRQADCHYERIPAGFFGGELAPGLDPAQAREAVSAYRRFLLTYPNDPLVPEATQRLENARLYLAESELGIVRFYVDQGYPQAALVRVNRLLENYGDTAAAPETAFYKVVIFEKMRLHEEARAAVADMQTRFPGNEFTRRAGGLLDGGG